VKSRFDDATLSLFSRFQGGRAGGNRTEPNRTDDDDDDDDVDDRTDPSIERDVEPTTTRVDAEEGIDGR